MLYPAAALDVVRRSLCDDRSSPTAVKTKSSIIFRLSLPLRSCSHCSLPQLPHHNVLLPPSRVALSTQRQEGHHHQHWQTSSNYSGRRRDIAARGWSRRTTTRASADGSSSTRYSTNATTTNGGEQQDFSNSGDAPFVTTRTSTNNDGPFRKPINEKNVFKIIQVRKVVPTYVYI